MMPKFSWPGMIYLPVCLLHCADAQLQPYRLLLGSQTLECPKLLRWVASGSGGDGGCCMLETKLRKWQEKKEWFHGK